jgi:hypothetical protein
MRMRGKKKGKIYASCPCGSGCSIKNKCKKSLKIKKLKR